MELTPFEQEELETLQREFYLCSLGDRPSSPAASKIARKMKLERKARLDPQKVDETARALWEADCRAAPDYSPARGLLSWPSFKVGADPAVVSIYLNKAANLLLESP